MRSSEEEQKMTIQSELIAGLLKTTLMVLMLLTLASVCLADDWLQPDRPVSAEVIKGAPGPKPECQTEYEVWGIGMHKKKDKAAINALLDARRSVCKHALFGGDGLLITADQEAAFAKVADRFYLESTVSGFITQVSSPAGFRKLDKKGRKVKAKYFLTLDYCLLKDWLIANGVLGDDWTPASIMVLPDVGKGISPLDFLDDNVNVRQGKAVIENFLTSQGDFEVLDPDASQSIENILEVTDLVEDNPDDIVYRVALSIGADIYIRYEVSVERNTTSGTTTHKALVRMTAYETTTAKQIATQTGYSPSRPTKVPESALIEEALSSEFRDIIQRLKTHWANESKRGVQYLVVMSISDEADEDDVMDIQDCFEDTADQVASTSKAEFMGRGKMRYRLWVDSEKIGSLNKLSRALRRSFPENCPDWKIRTGGNSFGKLLTGTIVAE
jgi:hypothetical protein